MRHGCALHPPPFSFDWERGDGGGDELVIETEVLQGEHGWVGAYRARGGSGRGGIGAVESETTAGRALGSQFVALDTASLTIKAPHSRLEVASSAERLAAASRGGDDGGIAQPRGGVAALRGGRRVAGRRRGRAIRRHGEYKDESKQRGEGSRREKTESRGEHGLG